MKETKHFRFAYWGFALILGVSSATSAFAEDLDLVVTKQPDTVYVAINDDGGTATISFEVEGGENVSYQWYQSLDGTNQNGTPIEGATTSSWTTPKIDAVEFNYSMPKTEDMGRFFYCVATAGEKSVTSNVTFVGNTGLPTLYVNTPDGKDIPYENKEIWVDGTTLTLRDAGEYNFENVKTEFRGRGNSTWEQVKKPYAIKLNKSEKRGILGMPSHRRWVLIANYLDNSFLKNHLAFLFSKFLGLDYTVRGKFVNLVFNGTYRGLYWLGEAIKVDENRVNIYDGDKKMTDDQDKDLLIEMDTHYDEVVKFKSPIRKIPYMIKNDDYFYDENKDGSTTMTSGGIARLERFQAKVEALEKLLYPDYKEGMNTNDCSAPDEAYANIIDVVSWAKFWFVNEIMDNTELLTDPSSEDTGPKSAYFTYEFGKDLFKAGPVWDFDAGLKTEKAPVRLDTSIYFNALFKSPSFVAATKKIYENANIENDEFYKDMINTINSLGVAAFMDSLKWFAGEEFAGKEQYSYMNSVMFVFDAMINKMKAVDVFMAELQHKFPDLNDWISSVESAGKMYVLMDGENGNSFSFDMPMDFDFDGVFLSRNWTPNVFSTLMLPFDVNTANVRGVEMVLKFNGIKQKEDKSMAVSMKKVWQKGVSKKDADINAYTPYMVLMNENSLRIYGGVTIKKTVEPVAKVEGSDWEFHGTLGYKKWESGDADLGRVYGFAAEASDGIDVGQFVRAGAGAYIYPLRAYLLSPAKAQGIKGNFAGAKSLSTMSLPETINVEIEDDEDSATEPKTTVIGQFNTRTGEFKMMNYNRGTFDLKGRNVGNSANKARGAYYGKTVK